MMRIEHLIGCCGAALLSLTIWGAIRSSKSAVVSLPEEEPVAVVLLSGHEGVAVPAVEHTMEANLGKNTPRGSGIESEPGHPEHRQVVQLERLAAQNPLRALSQALQETTYELREVLLQAVLRGWAGVNLNHAAQWARSQQLFPQELGIAAVFNGGNNRPDQIIQWARELSEEEPGRTCEFGGYLIYALGRAGQHEAAANIAREARAEIMTHWLTAAYHDWGRRDPEGSVLASLELTDGGMRATAFKAAVGGWAMTNPQELVDYAAGFPRGPEQDFALMVGLRSWIDSDPATAASWILRLERWIPVIDAALEN